MDADTLATVLLTTLGGFSGIYLRISALERRLTAHIRKCNGEGDE